MFYKTLRDRSAIALNLEHCIILMTVLFFLSCFHEEGVHPEDNEGEKTGDDVPSEDEEKSGNDTTAINLDNEKPEDDNDANCKKTVFCIPILSVQGNKDSLLSTKKFLIFINAL